MKRIRQVFVATLAGLTVLWLLSDTAIFTGPDFFPLRHLLMNYTGIVGIGVMSFGMILAARPARLEPWLGGLDKSYRLHKWLGITGLAVSIIHWLWAKGPKWAVGWGWLEKPARKPLGEALPAVFEFFRSQRGLAEQIGEWAFYAAAVLLVLALVQRFPYRHFFNTHRWLALIYLFLVFHSVILMEYSYWGEMAGPLMAVLMAGGTVAAFISLLRKVGAHRQSVGVIETLLHYPDKRGLEVLVALKDYWPGHQAGQFAFVSFDEKEGAHPFTISSAWHGDGQLSFIIKGLGDYTNSLPDTLKTGDPVRIEGPYGGFDFEHDAPRQIWVGGGIGITPFIARMQALAKQPDGRAIDLFYSTDAPDQRFIDTLRQTAERVRVRLYVWIPSKDGFLTAERLRQIVSDWSSASVWFCGPAGFGQALREDFTAHGLAFHQELFNMR